MHCLTIRVVTAIEAISFSLFTACYIWKLQETRPMLWVIFLVWLPLSFLVHRDTPKTLGWRADNLWRATRHAAIVFAIFIAGAGIAGFFLGGLHRVPEHLIEPRRLGNYFAFCVLQQVALQSYLMNRLMAAMPSPGAAAVLAGAIFAALHWPNPVLVPLTFVGGTAMCRLFARERNILPLALGQAILGGLVWWAFPVAWHHAMRVGPGYYTFRH